MDLRHQRAHWREVVGYPVVARQARNREADGDRIRGYIRENLADSRCLSNVERAGVRLDVLKARYGQAENGRGLIPSEVAENALPARRGRHESGRSHCEDLLDTVFQS